MLAKPFKLADPNQGVKLMLVEHQRELPEVKSTNYIKPISLLRQQKAAQADDVLYHLNGFISESSRSNVFIVKKEKLITPKTGVLAGITRKHILNIAKDHFEVEVRDVSLHETLDADEIFMSGSTKRIVPVTHVDEYQFEKGKVTTKLFELLLENEKNLNYAATV